MSLKIGVSLGSHDSPSAICVVEQPKPENEGAPSEPAGATDLIRALLEEKQEEILDQQVLTLKQLETFPGGTAMVDVASRLCEIVQAERGPESRAELRICLDVTGKGEPLLDMFAEKALDCRVLPVYVNSGDQLLTDKSHGFEVGIQLLATKVKLLFELGRLRMTSDQKVEVENSLIDFDVTSDSDTKSRPSALVVALGLAVAERGVGIQQAR